MCWAGSLVMVLTTAPFGREARLAAEGRDSPRALRRFSSSRLRFRDEVVCWPCLASPPRPPGAWGKACPELAAWHAPRRGGPEEQAGTSVL